MVNSSSKQPAQPCVANLQEIQIHIIDWVNVAIQNMINAAIHMVKADITSEAEEEHTSSRVSPKILSMLMRACHTYKLVILG